mgnify:CR=1 FL=1
MTDADELPDSLTDAEREILEASEAIGLEDEEGLVHVFAYPVDQDPEAVADVARRLSSFFEDADTVHTTARVDGDFGVDTMEREALDAIVASRVRDVGGE